ncbi:helix-turn-helix domain-containing protein [Acuticoccus sp. M5D2P5]|uniref:helix-turn-helix domain-containing protein n=1 Tax=Acuticoccus kalidii TaxID=2910977 RepID=UPI001F467A09|nr:helix-turn-helix transcriptional regulator [Acuticoccus kalidii]MCF3935449.1 helix-turn-helix domain-containing protein [Acuticoccus kalidii]
MTNASAERNTMSESRPENVPNQRSANSVDSHVGSRVRLRRLELGLSQEKLADQLGITFQQVQKYERGTNRIGASRLHQIALVLQAPITYFFDGASEHALPRNSDASPLAQALSDPATVRLVRAFASISDPHLKQKAVGIIEAIAETSSSARSDEPA